MPELTPALFAATTAQAIGIVIAVIAVLVVVVYAAFNVRAGRDEVGSEIELAANLKPYYADDELETKKLDRALTAGLAGLDIALAGQGVADSAPPPVVVGGTDARGLLATAGPGGGGEVLATELDGTALVSRQPLSADPGGPIRELAAAGSGWRAAVAAPSPTTGALLAAAGLACHKPPNQGTQGAER